jgi:RNA polymerase sigma factor (sigma-70 family)
MFLDENNSNEQRHQLFSTRFLSITDPSSYCGRICGGLVYAFIRRTLSNYNLSTRYTENDILHEVFLRAWKALEQGKTITNLQAWIRGTSLNVIRELSRKEQNSCPIQSWQDFPDLTQIDRSPLRMMEVDYELKSIHHAFQTLKPIDRAILVLKVIKGYSWEQVSQILKDEGFKAFTIISLRKRKQRALDLLKIKLRGEE